MITQKIIGLTGPMASGKNFACSILEKYNCISVDADKLVHEAIENSKEKILLAFSKEAKEKSISILNENGTINRRELAKLVFASEENLKKQEKIVHPEVNVLMENFIAEHPNETIILNATVLYKTEIVKKCDGIIFVYAPIFARLRRAKKRDNISIFRILQRFYAQKHLFAKYKKLNTDIFKVRNNGSEKQLEKKLLQVLNSFETL